MSRLNDDTLGRVLDRLADVGTNRVLGGVILWVIPTRPQTTDASLLCVDHGIPIASKLLDGNVSA